MSKTNPLADHGVTVLTAGHLAAITYSVAANYVVQQFVLPFRCRILRCDVTAVIATNIFGNVHLYDEDGSAKISHATENDMAVTGTPGASISFAPTTTSTVWSKGTIIQLRGDALTGNSLMSEAYFGLVVLNVETP
jgi:hypothetical protein